MPHIWNSKRYQNPTIPYEKIFLFDTKKWSQECSISDNFRYILFDVLGNWHSTTFVQKKVWHVLLPTSCLLIQNSTAYTMLNWKMISSTCYVI